MLQGVSTIVADSHATPEVAHVAVTGHYGTSTPAATHQELVSDSTLNGIAANDIMAEGKPLPHQATGKHQDAPPGTTSISWSNAAE